MADVINYTLTKFLSTTIYLMYFFLLNFTAKKGQVTFRRREEASQEAGERAQETGGSRECREEEEIRLDAREEAQAQASDHEDGH